MGTDDGSHGDTTFQVVVPDQYVVMSPYVYHCGERTRGRALLLARPSGGGASRRRRVAVVTFPCTLESLALGRVGRRHLLRAAGGPANAGAVHRPHPEVDGLAQGQARHRVFAHLHRAVVTLDPVVATRLTPGEGSGGRVTMVI